MERSTPLKETIENKVDREEEYLGRFWARRPDGIVVDKKKEICYRTVEMSKGRGGGAVASVAERRELLQSETFQMYIPMCAYPCVHTCNIGVD